MVESSNCFKNHPTGLLLAVGLELPPSVADYLADFRASYDPGYDSALSNTGAHITLKRPGLMFGPESTVLTKIKHLVKNIPALHIRVGGITVYHSPDATAIYLRVIPDPELLKLHSLLVVGLQEWLPVYEVYEGRHFVPHVTLANWLPDCNLGRAMKDLQELNLLTFDKNFQCGELSVAVSTEDFRGTRRTWRRLSTYALGPSQELAAT